MPIPHKITSMELRNRTGLKMWKCKTCSANFQRLDHMKRHALTHHTAKSHLCSFCGSAFSRGDVLRRHWKSCKARVYSGHAIPEPERGGKHKRACDSCASLRKACSGEMPCAECTQREKQCTYQRLLGNERPLPSISDELSLSSTSQNLLEIPAESSGAKDMVPKASESSWDLGPATLYPSNKEVLDRRRGFVLG